ncbi:MAG: hypothetical protein U0T84_09785 [Chitinophagales bacterium]
MSVRSKMRFPLLPLGVLLITLWCSKTVVGQTAAIDSGVINISLLMPFDQSYSAWKIYGYLNEEDPAKIETHRLRGATAEVLDFFEGFRYAVKLQPPPPSVNIYAFDSYTKDSILEEVLHNDTIRSSQIIIGPATVSQAKMVGAFCKKNKIINIQPIVASKAIVNENPFMVRLMPTIDAHMARIFEQIRDSFASSNVIIYTTKRERDGIAAKSLDSLMRQYNASTDVRIKYFFVNAGDTTKSAQERSISNYMSSKGNNVVVVCCYDDGTVSSTIRGLPESTIVFGMPTWLEAEQVKPDILNRSQPYLTDPFYADTTSEEMLAFEKRYLEENGQYPGKYCYIGFDTWNYLKLLIDQYGLNFREHLSTTPFTGKGIDFRMAEIKKPSKSDGTPITAHYDNFGMRLFRVSDFRILPVGR